ncbi:collagen alpha-1(I) chain-like [Elephas maximus indicus]|uniref:collagen alpha-1(I) chain-like n=1 Tax=Elephas maximus indicus TaxID=99487 RepID=UPI0021162BF4|nr:collagen alpha-1(I) chain-like [Elephas maximus indicus]
MDQAQVPRSRIRFRSAAAAGSLCPVSAAGRPYLRALRTGKAGGDRPERPKQQDKVDAARGLGGAGRGPQALSGRAKPRQPEAGAAAILLHWWQEPKGGRSSGSAPQAAPAQPGERGQQRAGAGRWGGASGSAAAPGSRDHAWPHPGTVTRNARPCHRRPRFPPAGAGGRAPENTPSRLPTPHPPPRQGRCDRLERGGGGGRGGTGAAAPRRGPGGRGAHGEAAAALRPDEPSADKPRRPSSPRAPARAPQPPRPHAAPRAQDSGVLPGPQARSPSELASSCLGPPPTSRGWAGGAEVPSSSRSSAAGRVGREAAPRGCPRLGPGLTGRDRWALLRGAARSLRAERRPREGLEESAACSAAAALIPGLGGRRVGRREPPGRRPGRGQGAGGPGRAHRRAHTLSPAHPPPSRSRCLPVAGRPRARPERRGLPLPTPPRSPAAPLPQRPPERRSPPPPPSAHPARDPSRGASTLSTAEALPRAAGPRPPPWGLARLACAGWARPPRYPS